MLLPIWGVLKSLKNDIIYYVKVHSARKARESAKYVIELYDCSFGIVYKMLL